jgi:HEXXH motif-containing protein
MTPYPHRIPFSAFTTLAEGDGGKSVVGYLVAAQHSKHVLLLRRVFDLAHSAGHEQAADARRAYSMLAAVQDRQPEAAAAVVLHPSVGAWARQTVDALSSPQTSAKAEPGRIAALAAAAAVRSRMPCSIELPGQDGGILLPSLGRAAGPAAGVRISADGAEVGGIQLPGDPSVDVPGWQGLRHLSAAAQGKALNLLIDDLDPYRAPGADNKAGRLPAADMAHWQAVLDSAWDLLVRHHPTVAEEVAAMTRVLTPLTPPPGGHVSATSRETFGSIALSTPPDACSLAVTLAHEVQHAKMCALLDMVPLTRPDDGRHFYAPWREDPRPVSGLLQGAYAFLGVAGFWRRQSHLDDREAALAEFARWRDAVRVVVNTLVMSGQLSASGELFAAGMDRTLQRWEAEPVPASALARARQIAMEHRERWRRRNGEIPLQVG